jgi:hypothetical protein
VVYTCTYIAQPQLLGPVAPAKGSTPAKQGPQQVVNVATTGTQAAQQVPFLAVDFEQNPLDGSADTKIHVICQATLCVVHAVWVDRIMKFSIPPRPVDLQVAASWSAQTLVTLQQYVAFDLAMRCPDV